MSYPYAVDAQSMFEDRAAQFTGLGIPAQDVAEVRSATDDFWADAPGGWVFEWSALAARYAEAGDHGRAALAYGFAKFPCLADAARRTAADQQLAQYVLAAPHFPVHFERRTLDLPGQDGTVELPVHLYAETKDVTSKPVLLLSGGVDTFKMDLHAWCVTLTQRTGMVVLAFDLPGTGENPVPLGPPADEQILALVAAARGIGNGLVGHFGTSFGANFAAMTGLLGVVDAAVVLGGPVGDSFQAEHLRALPYGMPDIVGNALGFDHPVTTAELVSATSALTRTGLLEQDTNAPMLVVNGADDYFIPRSDVHVFDGIGGIETHLLDGSGHCAMSRAPEVLALVIGWLRTQFCVTSPSPSAQGEPNRDAAVLVVGAGPVGLVLACELARRHIPVRVIDKLAAPTDQSRAIIVHPRSLEMLRRIGVADQLIGSGRRSTGLTAHARGKVLAEIPFDDIDSAYRFSVITAQTETERILTERLRDLGVTVERSAQLVSFEQDDDGVHYLIRHTDGQTEAATAGWVVGTDGSHSTVRDLMGQSLDGSFKGERFFLGDIDAEYSLPHNRAHIFFHANGPLLVFPMLGQRVRVIASLDHRDHVVTPDLLRELAEQRGVALEVLAVRWLTIFEIHHAQVPRYRVGRAFLAGDAAHVHSPAGGQGMNTGMQDAFNLGWKLAAVIHGNADQTLLDSYHQERHPVAATVIKQTTALTTMGTLQRPVQQAVRDLALTGAARFAAVRATAANQLEEVSIAYPDSPIVGGHRGRRQVQPGQHAPDVPGTDLGPRLAAHPGHLALVFGHTAPAMTTALTGLPRLNVHAPVDKSHDLSDHPHPAGPDDIEDSDGAIHQRYGRRTGDVVLIRPDGYVGLVATRDQASLVHQFRTGAPTQDLAAAPAWAGRRAFPGGSGPTVRPAGRTAAFCSAPPD